MTRCAAFFWLSTLLFVAAGPALAESPLSPSQYVDLLHRYQKQIEELPSAPQKAVALRDSLPDSMAVQTSRGNVTVDLTFLRNQLNRYLVATPQVKSTVLSNASARLNAMSAEAQTYEQPGRADDPTRKRLDDILSGREFNRVHGPTALELFKERVQAWIANLLRKIHPNIPDVEDAGQWFVWSMIALASAIAAVWLYRVSKQSMASGPREIFPFAPSSRNWREWLADARERASRGEWRDAIHFGFWAAVSRLEAEGVWPPDKTRTPREYLRAIPGSNLSKEPFAAMTREFEWSWYGTRPATEADFAQFAAHLERIGCR